MIFIKINKNNDFETPKGLQQELDEKMKNAFKQLKNIEGIISLIDKTLDSVEEYIEPMYKTAKKASKFMKKFMYTVDVFTQFQKLMPFIAEATGKKSKMDSMFK